MVRYFIRDKRTRSSHAELRVSMQELHRYLASL
jgi:hypothetical protein